MALADESYNHGWTPRHLLPGAMGGQATFAGAPLSPPAFFC